MEEYRSFAALIYATETEHVAVRKMYQWTVVRIEGDDQIYYRCEVPQKGTVYAARQDEIGMTASATLTMKLIQHFRPRYIIMPGIAAGVKDLSSEGQMFGDVVMADLVWNCSNGKYVPKEQAEIVTEDVGFQPRPTRVLTDPSLLPYFEKAVRSEENQTRVHIGAIASGSGIIADKGILVQNIRSQPFQTVGLEMEGYGVAYAAAHATEPRPKTIIAKSICDFADHKKTDRFQPFAAHTSCEFVQFLLEKILD